MSFQHTNPGAITVASGSQATISFTAQSTNANGLTVTYSADNGLFLDGASVQTRQFALTPQSAPIDATFTFTGNPGIHTVDLHAVDSTGDSDDMQVIVNLT